MAYGERRRSGDVIEVHFLGLWRRAIFEYAVGTKIGAKMIDGSIVEFNYDHVRDCVQYGRYLR